LSALAASWIEAPPSIAALILDIHLGPIGAVVARITPLPDLQVVALPVTPVRYLSCLALR
jgi:hypothetical protein